MELSLQSRHQVMTTIDGVIKRAALPRVAGLGRHGMRGAFAVGAAGAAFSHIAPAVGSCEPHSSSIQKPATPYPSLANAATIKRSSSHIFAQTSGKAGNDHNQFACLDWLRHMHLETRCQRPHSILTSGIRRQRHCGNAPSSLRP